MGQLTDIPYSIITQDKQAYEIMLLHDQDGETYTNIAKKCNISVARATQNYSRLKIKQIRLYINHIAVVFGHKNTLQIRKVYQDAYECYQDPIYACAFLEKKYNDILREYRDGEPGMPIQFIKSIPPFKRKLTEKTIARVIEMRDVEKTSFVQIAKELRITQAKAKHTYSWFYHEQVMDFIKIFLEKAESEEEKDAIWAHYFKQNKSSKKYYDILMKG